MGGGGLGAGKWPGFRSWRATWSPSKPTLAENSRRTGEDQLRLVEQGRRELERVADAQGGDFAQGEIEDVPFGAGRES